MTAARIPWWHDEPDRLARDQREISAVFPTLEFSEDGQGCWAGRLPVWPFQRTAPARLDELVPTGVGIVLVYGAAYPMVSPAIVPLEPRPLPIEMTQARWHVLGNGALCLFQTQADWDPDSSIVDLLLKAAGWRIEHALMKAGLIDAMLLAGIVKDPTLDHLIPQAVARIVVEPTGEPT